MLRTTDNNVGKWRTGDNHQNDCRPEECHLENLKYIANKNILELQKQHHNLLVFPQKWQLGVEKKNIIFELSHDGILKTNNIMGFIGCGETQLTISSRFHSQSGDYFLHHMLSKVLGINVVNMNFQNSDESIHDFLPYLFPSYLQDALSQGLFKQYQRNQYNDSNVKGAININRHIKLNNPFVGKIAYTMREHSHDNAVTQLIRHTVEYLRMREFGHSILTGNPEIRACVSQIEYATPSYKKSDLQKVIRENLKPVNHPYFVKYQNLQKLCLMILRREKTSFGSKNEIHGLLFDGAWLWEEYLNKIFTEQKLDFIHAENRTGKNPIYLFTDNKLYDRYPDFYKEDFVLDAKYRPRENIGRDDFHQIISYMYIQQVKLGGFIYPCKTEEKPESTIGTLKGYGGEIKMWSLQIPQDTDSFKSFSKKIQENEAGLKDNFTEC
ncbi:MAG: McrC family protein [Fibrobacter sp.]|jgi:5-methylcytosine-specific restriction endonuclease McrBC regulatory subunit McrC|nr:McrC family protein [Fibrobacter sp.]